MNKLIICITSFVVGLLLASYYFVVIIDDGFWIYVVNGSNKEISRFEVLIDKREVVQKNIAVNNEIGIYIPQSTSGSYNIRVMFEDGFVIEKESQAAKPGSFQYEIVDDDKVLYRYRGRL